MEKLLLKILFQKVLCVEGYSDKMNIFVLWSCVAFKLLLMQSTFEVEKEKLIKIYSSSTEEVVCLYSYDHPLHVHGVHF